jgi:hypothetical protein
MLGVENEKTENLLSLVYLFNPHSYECDSGHVKFSYNLYITMILTQNKEDTDINKEVIHS